MLCSERDVYAFARQPEGDAQIVALNLSRDTRNVSLPVKGLVLKAQTGRAFAEDQIALKPGAGRPARQGPGGSSRARPLLTDF